MCFNRHAVRYMRKKYTQIEVKYIKHTLGQYKYRSNVMLRPRNDILDRFSDWEVKQPFHVISQ